MADINFVPSVDYTSRDYTSILADMTALIPSFAPNWTNRDPSDFGIILLELFAYMGDILNYYIDRAANEAFIATATQRESVLQLANLLGYTPAPLTASTVTLTFQNSSSSPITVPELTQVATSTVANASTSQVLFETDAAVTVPAATGATPGAVTVAATQGYTVANEVIGVSDGSPSQYYRLLNANVISGSINIVINGVTYQYVTSLIDSGGYDPVFSTLVSADNYTYLQFGDNVTGRIPPTGIQIYATYRVGDGSLGNVASNTIKYILSLPGVYSIPAGLSVINQDILVSGDGAATGGADPESTDSIRINAPASISVINRAVSLTDYAALAVQVPSCHRAIAISNVYTSVTIYALPFGDPGVASDNSTLTTVFNTMATAIQTTMASQIPSNTTLTIQPPKYVGVYLVISLTIDPKYSQSTVVSSVTSNINNLFDIDNVLFNDTIYRSDVYGVVNQVGGILQSNIIKMVRADQDQTFTISNKALTSNVATLTTSTSHNLTVGQTVSVSSVDATFNGTYVVTGTTSNTFSYSLIATNVSSASASGSVTALTVTDIACAANEIPTLYQLGTTASPTNSGIGSVTINASGGILN